MKLKTYDDPRLFLQTAQPFLERDEVLNSLILGINMRLVEHPEWSEGTHYQATVEDESGAVILAASITPRQNILIAGAPDLPQAALDLLAKNLLQGGWKFPGVNGEKVLSERTAGTWAQLTGTAYRVRMRLRAYELRRVTPPTNPQGSLRVAGVEDLDLIVAWREAFELESLHKKPTGRERENVLRMIEAGNLYLWDDKGPASMAASTRPTLRGISIGAVYTPPEKRGRGYASACVAALSQRMLDSGKLFCALFTDLDYPTSNSIYQKIGYRVVGDFLECEFV